MTMDELRVEALQRKRKPPEEQATSPAPKRPVAIDSPDRLLSQQASQLAIDCPVTQRAAARSPLDELDAPFALRFALAAEAAAGRPAATTTLDALDFARRRTAVLLDAALPGADAPPNHISFLSEGTNDEMVKFLSPFLPLARLLGIPLLDFDAYQLSGDAAPTARAVTPAVVSFFRANA